MAIVGKETIDDIEIEDEGTTIFTFFLNFNEFLLTCNFYRRSIESRSI